MIRLTRPICPNPSALATNYKHPHNKTALQAACFDKCMYCESRVSQVYYGDVEHIKPKALFPLLEFVWENLGYVCAICNGNKSDKWSETTPFINPFEEDPDIHLVAVGAFVLHRNGSERGEYTCRELELNRVALLEKRGERIRALHTLVDKAARTRDRQLASYVMQDILQELNDDNEYAMVTRAAHRLLGS